MLAVSWVCLQFVIVVFLIHTHYINCASFAFNFSCYSYQTCIFSLRRISFLKIFLVCLYFMRPMAVDGGSNHTLDLSPTGNVSMCVCAYAMRITISCLAHLFSPKDNFHRG